MNYSQIPKIFALILGSIFGFYDPAFSHPKSNLEIAFENACMANSNVEAMPQEFRPPTFATKPLPEALNTANAWQTVGENAAISGDYHNAIQAFNKAIDLSNGENPELFEQRGWLHYIQDNYQQALADLKAAALLYDEMDNTAGRWDTCHMVSYVERQRV